MNNKTKKYFLRAVRVTAAGLLLAHTAAHADQLHQQAWAVPAKGSIVLATYYEILNSNCRVLQAPSIVVTTTPKLGKLTILKTVGLADNPAQCMNLSVPVSQVVYNAGAAAGVDAFSWAVRFQSHNLGTLRVAGKMAVKSTSQ